MIARLARGFAGDIAPVLGEGRGDVRDRRGRGRGAAVGVQAAGEPGGREPCAPSATGGAAPRDAPSAPSPRGPSLLGPSVPHLVALDRRAGDRPACDGDRMASSRLWSVLDVEVAAHGSPSPEPGPRAAEFARTRSGAGDAS